MKRNFFLFLCFMWSAIVCGQTPGWVKRVGARSFPAVQKIYSVNGYRVYKNSSKLSTDGIQKAIDACSKKGGGIVRFEKGTYTTGALFIREGVQLCIDEGVLLLGSEDIRDYPEIDSRIAGIEMKWPSALINILNVKNAALTGKGVVNARGRFNWDLYWKMNKEYTAKGLRWIVDYDVKRVRTLLVQNCENITLKEVTFKNAGFWTVQVLYSKQITIDGLVIRNNEDGHGPSTDGIDIDSSSWVLVEHCDIDCNDDNFCLKAGRDWDGLRVNRPTEYIVIRKSLARRGAGLITIGSETSGGIRHVLAEDLQGKNTDNGLRIKSATTRGGTVEDVYFRNVVLDSVNNVFQFNLNWYPAYSYSTLPGWYTYETVPSHWRTLLQKVEPAESGIPQAKDFYIENISATNVNTAIVATGLPQSLIRNFHFKNCRIEARMLSEMEYTKDWHFDNFIVSIDKKNAAARPGGKETEERMK
ncbi:glycoside hydrolase family 28 protein [Niabella beijingensis]|uniref:glycoside hydrolase family 28 protein n=1 Tax=Niabella beijingensis TaxID=2872700 RepID=UPI001CC085B8|nr:glycosyl hydrolase family 28 protein [Niabella beijingensis]